MDKWLKIAEAPKDGRMIVAIQYTGYDLSQPMFVRWKEDAWGGFWIGWTKKEDPTHFCELPDIKEICA